MRLIVSNDDPIEINQRIPAGLQLIPGMNIDIYDLTKGIYKAQTIEEKAQVNKTILDYYFLEWFPQYCENEHTRLDFLWSSIKCVFSPTYQQAELRLSRNTKFLYTTDFIKLLLQIEYFEALKPLQFKIELEKYLKNHDNRFPKKRIENLLLAYSSIIELSPKIKQAFRDLFLF